MGRVKFYPRNDFACGYNLKASEELLKLYGAGKEAQDINDLLELYNVKKYFEHKIYLLNWTSNEIKHYEGLVKSYFGKVARFFKTTNKDRLVEQYDNVDREYKEDFWELIEKFKVYESIPEESFTELLDTSKVWLHELLKYQEIVEYFGHVIREYMLNNSFSAKLLLDEYEIKHISEKEPLYFPKELSGADKELIINRYIESEDPNLNYLRLIANIQSNKDRIEISPKTLLKAKRRAEEQEKQFFNENSGILMETKVSFSESQDEEAIVKLEGQSLSATYSKKWIEENMDYPTLLNNFIYLFEFVDLQMRCMFVNKPNEMGVFERFIFTTSRNAYIKGIAFDHINSLVLLQMAAYYNQLFSIGIRLEEIIEWFFREYLSNEFNANNFRVTMPSSNSTMLEKCTNIMPAMESVLKQFSLFVQEGEIDFDLLDIRSEHLIYKNIPSLVQKKYVYGLGNEFKTATFLLFSDQSGLGYHEKFDDSYENYFALLCNEKFRLEDYPDYEVPRINWLIEHKYLAIDKEGYIIFYDRLLITILKDLYFYQVVSYWKYPKHGREIIDELHQRKVIEFESSLFSRPEQDYINYLLNKSQFNNGLDLRNKYSHTQPYVDNDEKVHNQNYMTFLKLFIVSVIKINDDFCIADKIGNSYA